MIPMAEHSAIREAFTAVGATMNMVETTGRMRYRLKHGDYDLPQTGGGGLYGMIEFAFEGNTATAQPFFQQIRDALDEIPPDSMMFEEWLGQRTGNDNIKDLFQGFCAALMGTNPHEIPAGEFFRWLKYSSRGSRFGLAAAGNGDLMKTLATAIEERGSEIRLHTICRDISHTNGAISGVVLRSKERGEESVECDYVLSNTGPQRTIRLTGGRQHFDSKYLRELDAAPHEAPILHIAFVTDEPLIEDFDGSLVFGNNKNLIYLEIPSIISPQLAPPGKYLHTAYGAPWTAANTDLKEDLDNTLRELENNFPGQLQGAEFLVKARHSGEGPAGHRCAGFTMPVSTSVRNLYNVGDGCTMPGTMGTEGAAASAKEAARQILNS